VCSSDLNNTLARPPPHTTTMYFSSRLPTPHRAACFGLTTTFFIVIFLALAHRDLRGEIIKSPSSPASVTAASSLRSQTNFVSEQQQWHGEDVTDVVSADLPADHKKDADDSHFVFLQKFPLEHTFKMLFHTEVVVCPREPFKDTAFLNFLEGKLKTLTPSKFDETASLKDTAQSPFVAIEKEQWSKQSEPGCVQLGYGGANCDMGCCGSPHKHQNSNYALSSKDAVIGNAMGDHKELYLYGVSGSVGGDEVISGEDAYKAVCHGHMNAIEMGVTPVCVSNWAGKDYNPLTNNCNTFTSTVLKCVYGFSDAKPHLGVSDMITVKCPTEKKEDGVDVNQCVIPTMDERVEVGRKDLLSLE